MTAPALEHFRRSPDLEWDPVWEALDRDGGVIVEDFLSHELLERLRRSGVGVIYAEPKSWPWGRALCSRPQWRHPELVAAAARGEIELPEHSDACRRRPWLQQVRASDRSS